MLQKTIAREIYVEGTGLHTGTHVRMSLHPASENTGVVFRSECEGPSVVRAHVDRVGDSVRGTTLVQDSFKVQTVEHLLSALYGLSIDNVEVALEGGEVPILDGSARPYVELIRDSGTVVQAAERDEIELIDPISITDEDRSLTAIPYEGFRVTCTSSDDRGNHTQHLSLEIDPEVYAEAVAPARTFTPYEDIEPLLRMGKIKGGTLESAIVIKGDAILSKEPLRFKDEFVRHKILDLIGDLALLGRPLRAHVIAVKPGHALNVKLTAAILRSVELAEHCDPLRDVATGDTALDVRKILQLLPHRYPFVLLDRILKVEGDTLYAVKNVTINEHFFNGHFPHNPVMPGVLQLEAMAQAAGLLMSLREEITYGDKTAFLMSADRVRFRQVVRPGDQLVVETRLLKIKNGKIGSAEALCKVGNTVVSSAELMFMIVHPNGS
jgi:UDP-3-O-[3-hydroxymyristoyl] N-acetylglucosamine deacetylase/3-hydroxyacyl-[acyl-carrier-protein] dehydratase